MELFQEMVTAFLGDWPRLLATLRHAITTSDTFALTRDAHALTGALGSLGAMAALEAGQYLEGLGRNGTLSDAPAALAVLEAEVVRLLSVLASVQSGQHTGAGG
jgi:HPt (histidine-containing phosphotransfer) domain-containing protein